jgi:hypothetical protein
LPERQLIQQARWFDGDAEKRLRFRESDQDNTLRIGADAMSAPFPDVAIERGISTSDLFGRSHGDYPPAPGIPPGR